MASLATILSLDEARHHCRLEDDYPEDQLLPYMRAAESFVAAHLNRSVFADEDALLDAQARVSTKMAEAYEAYQLDVDAADQADDAVTRQALMDLARVRLESAQLGAQRVINGVVASGAIRSAMLLTLGNLFANREADVVGASVAQLPQGVPELLRPFRLVQMP